MNKLINSEKFNLSELHVLYSRLHAVKVELSALNTELETYMTDEQVADYYDSVLEYEDAAIGALALLEHNIELLNVSSPPWMSQPSATAFGGQPVTPDAEEMRRPQSEFGAQMPKLIFDAKAGSSVRHKHIKFGTPAKVQRLKENFEAISADSNGCEEVDGSLLNAVERSKQLKIEILEELEKRTGAIVDCYVCTTACGCRRFIKVQET